MKSCPTHLPFGDILSLIFRGLTDSRRPVYLNTDIVVLMAELATVNAVASILQLVDFASKVLVRLKDFHDQASEVPRVFR